MLPAIYVSRVSIC